jgi:hypothetical protein
LLGQIVDVKITQNTRTSVKGVVIKWKIQLEN